METTTTSLKVKRSKIKVTRPNAEITSVSYIPNGKAYIQMQMTLSPTIAMTSKVKDQGLKVTWSH